MPGAEVAFELTRGFEAIDAGKRQVHQDRRGGQVVGQLEGFADGAGRGHPVAAHAEPLGVHLAGVGVIVDDQHERMRVGHGGPRPGV